MKRLLLVLSLLALATLGFLAPATASGPSGSTECHVQDDDCDTQIDEDSGAATDDSDGDGRIDEDPAGDANGDLNPDDDLDGAIDEDVPDDDGDGAVDEDPPGDALDDAGENQVDCNEASSTDVAGAAVHASGSGVEVCNEGAGAVPVQGRAIVSSDGYVTADGDADNAEPVTGYARFDSSGVHCGDELNQDATGDQSGNTDTDCNA